MKAHIRSSLSVAWLLAAAVAAVLPAASAFAQGAAAELPEAAPTTQPTTAPAAKPAPISAQELPPVESFTAQHKSGDDGSAIVIQWARPAGELPDAKYVVEIASRSEDFGKKDGYKTKEIVVAPLAAGDMYTTEITPSQDQYFPFPKPPELSIDHLDQSIARLKELCDGKVVTDAEFARAVKLLKILATEAAQAAAPAPKPATAPATKPATAPSATGPATRPTSRPAAATSKPVPPPPLYTIADVAWLNKLDNYGQQHDWLKTFAPPTGDLLTPDQLPRALAALRRGFPGRFTPSAADPAGARAGHAGQGRAAVAQPPHDVPQGPR